MRLNSAKEILEVIEKDGYTLPSLSLMYESSKTGDEPQKIVDYLKEVISVMFTAVDSGINDTDNNIHGKIIGNDSVKIKKRYEEDRTICGLTIAKASAYAMSNMEVNASMGRVVACPTAGSCGVLPAVLKVQQERFGYDDDALIEGLLAANLVGSVVARNATISGAEGGCQAEVGTASAMASAACVIMAGGSAGQAFEAGAMCFKNLLGLVCDPIAGLVEAPCAKRNAIGAANALMCAEMAMSGVCSVIPFDEVVEAMYRVGTGLPPSLRETARGGLAITKTAIQITNNLGLKV